MTKSIFFSALFVLTSTSVFASDTLDRFIDEIHNTVDQNSTNCFVTCNNVAIAATTNKAKLYPSSHTYSDASVLKTLSKREISSPDTELNSKLQLGDALARKTGIVHHVIPQRSDSGDAFRGLQLTKLAMHLPDLVEEKDDTHVTLKPLRHCFLIASDESDATICHSWENVVAFECMKPMPLPIFEAHLFALHERVETYLRDRNHAAYSSVLHWFLGDTVAKMQPIVLRKHEYNSLIESRAVKFFANRNDTLFIPAYFSFIASNDSQAELTRQISLATFAGKAVFDTTTLHASSWKLLSESEL